MAACWAERLRSVGKQADAMLKMLTVLHRMQLHSPAFAATLLSSSVHGKSLEAQLDELEGHYRGGGRNAFIRGYLGYLRLRLQARVGGGGGGGGGARLRRLGSAASPAAAMGQLPEWQNLFDAASTTSTRRAASASSPKTVGSPPPRRQPDLCGAERPDVQVMRNSATQFVRAISSAQFVRNSAPFF